MSLIQLNNLQNELTGLVESRFNSSMSLSSQQSVTGARTFTGIQRNQHDDNRFADFDKQCLWW